MPKIVTSGLNYIQAQVAGSQAVEITQAVVAYIDGLDHTAVIPDNSTLPAQVLETVDLIKGAISPHSIAYSAVLSDTLGDYAYNWIGLLSDTGELIAVETYPTQEKYKTQAGRVGNTLANNIILQFDNAQSLTSITVPAQSWQFDYTTELNRIETKAGHAFEYQREVIDKIFGSYFVGEGFQVENVNDELKIKFGSALIKGIYVKAANDNWSSTLSEDVWLEVWQSYGVNGLESNYQIHSQDTIPNSFIDNDGFKHYFQKLADIGEDLTILDDSRKFMIMGEYHEPLESWLSRLETRIRNNDSTASLTYDLAQRIGTDLSTLEDRVAKEDYVSILDTGTYTSGTYTIKDDRDWFSFKRIVMYSSHDEESTHKISSSEITRELIVDNLGTGWKLHAATVDQWVEITADTLTTFTISRSGNNTIRQIIGYLT